MMSMVYNPILSPNFIPPILIKPTRGIISLSPYLQCSSNGNKGFQLRAAASIAYPPINVDYLESEFSGHGVTFEGISDSCVVRMGLDNGSVATVMLPSGLITSYKAPMWHGGTLELLHTVVSEGESGGAVIQGGVSLAFNFGSEDGVSWSPTSWVLHEVKGSSQELIQVELISRSPEMKIEVKHILSLQKDVLSSEVVVTNNSDSSSFQLMGSFISHLTVSTPEATYAVGLEGSSFFTKPPFLSNFSILPPETSQNSATGSKNLWDAVGISITGYLSGQRARSQNTAIDTEREGREVEEMEGEEDDNYKHLTERMSRIYLDAPQFLTIIDRGRRNSIVIRREGLEEMYMFSPGSGHEWYGKYAFICIGHSALLQPVTVSPQGTWKGVQQLHNPNL